MVLDGDEYLDMDYRIGKEYGVYKIASVAKEKTKDGHKLYIGVCKVCGFERIAKLSDFKASPNRCVHLDSFAKMTDVQFETWYEENKRICLNCYRPIPLKKTDKKADYLIKKFCGKSCAASYNNRGDSLINPEDVQNLGRDYWDKAKESDNIDYLVGKTYGIFKILSREQERDPKSSKVLYRCVCLDCGIEKIAPLYKIKGYANHCTHVGKLSELSEERFAIWYENNKVQCQKCGKDIPVKEGETQRRYLNRKFCNECSSTIKKAKTSQGQKSKKRVVADKPYCESCGKELDTSRRFCNVQCYRDFEYKEYISRWKAGLESGIVNETELSPKIKKYIREKFNDKCTICGWDKPNPIAGVVSVEVHHIDGDYTNNSEDNLTLLCPCCHSLTPNYRGRNMGKGRYGVDEQKVLLRKEKYIGETFGIYTILNVEPERNKSGTLLYKGVCNECGYEKIAPISDFKLNISHCRHVKGKDSGRIRKRLKDLLGDEFKAWYSENKRHCFYCGKDLPADDCFSKGHYARKNFCDHSCYDMLQYRNYITRWKSGLESGIVGKLWLSDFIKRFLKEKYDNKCAVCGWNKLNPYTSKVPLEIHHIDGNYKNNDESNLTLLCPNCHSLTPNYKALNSGSGRQRNKK